MKGTGRSDKLLLQISLQDQEKEPTEQRVSLTKRRINAVQQPVNVGLLNVQTQ